MNVEPVEFGSALRTLRNSQGLSLGELSRLVNYSKSHLSRVENGKKQPTSDLARHCDGALGGEGRLIRIARSVPRRVASVVPTPTVRQLPRSVTDFVGRVDLLRRLDRMCPASSEGRHRGSPLVLVDGPAGIGKTETVLHWGHVAAERFGDGTLFADLNGFRQGGAPLTAEQVLRRFLHDLGETSVALRGRDAQQLGVRFRSLLTGKRMLIVLDNTTRPEQVRPLLPASPGCMTVVTSRSRMPGLLARDGALRLQVPPMAPEESRELLVTVDPESRLARRPEFLDACGHVPLLLRIASRRNMNPEFYDGLHRWESAAMLRLFSMVGDDSTSLRSLLQGSYEGLSGEATWAFRLLGTRTEGWYTVRDAARLLDTGPSAAEELLAELADLHLLRYRDGRFAFDPVHRAFAIERAGAVGAGRDG
ncbi:helix-turn-helix transcriptional regulator [Nocardiopsis sp. MG754419]|uniref:helix-turn-helix domain-containing protein n=1 Tax=Nocardiopsis sp. MG754419 TaxID=2259865 RepID=UPI001BAAF261|nr:helix-turn-helix transcriptional regulator [Nocardiopsis sp. MG754419]MBR8740612.1 hypothetical protein [Nocardiopsis sp. MG754419]